MPTTTKPAKHPQRAIDSALRAQRTPDALTEPSDEIRKRRWQIC